MRRAARSAAARTRDSNWTCAGSGGAVPEATCAIALPVAASTSFTGSPTAGTPASVTRMWPPERGLPQKTERGPGHGIRLLELRLLRRGRRQRILLLELVEIVDRRRGRRALLGREQHAHARRRGQLDGDRVQAIDRVVARQLREREVRRATRAIEVSERRATSSLSDGTTVTLILSSSYVYATSVTGTPTGGASLKSS